MAEPLTDERLAKIEKLIAAGIWASFADQKLLIAALQEARREISSIREENGRLRDALTAAANRFASYAIIYRLKGQAGEDKARSNEEMALMCEAALAVPEDTFTSPRPQGRLIESEPSVVVTQKGE